MPEKIRVLHVDDEPGMLDIGKQFLEKSGDFTVTTATSAPDAIRLIEQERFDVIVSDYQMPGMDGIEFLVLVRTRFGQIPFILFTGKGREEVVIQAINSGADFYLQKGGNPEAQFAELSHKIKSAASRKMAEESLKKSEEKYRHLIEHSVEAIIVVQDGMPKLVNHQTVEFTGYSEQELLSMSISAFIHPDDRAMVGERYQKRMKGEDVPSRYAFRLGSKDGSTRWVEISVSMVDWDGRPATLNFLTDITERKQAEYALTENEARLRTTLEILPVGVFIFSKSGQILTTNAMVNQIWGATNGVVPHSHDMQEFVEYKGWWSDTGIAMRPEDWAASRVLLKGETAPVDIVNIHRFDGSDGTIIVSAVPFHDDRGNVTGAVAVIQDITKQKQMDDVLRKSEQRYRGLFENMLEGFAYCRMLYDESGRPTDFTYLNVNPAFNRVIGTTVIVGKPATEVFPGIKEAFPELFEIYGRVALTGEPESFDIDFVPSKKWLHISVYSPAKEHFVAIFEDITERKRAERDLDLIFEHSLDMLCIAGFDGYFKRVSPSFENVLGWSETELLSKPLFDFIHPDDREASRQVAKDHEGRKEAICFENRYQCKDGSYKWISWNSHPIVEEKLIIGVARDITERKRAELELASALENLKEAHHLAHIGTWDWVKENDTVIWSEELYNITGRDPSLPAPTYAEHPHVYTPASWDLLNDAVTRALTTGEPYNLELEMLHTDGSRRWTNAFGGVQSDENGKVIRLHGTVQDITERKQAEAVLQENEEKYRTLFSGMPSGVAIYEAVDDGEDFVFRDFNTAGEAIEHVRKEEVIGRRVSEVFPGVKEFGILSVFQRVWRTGKPEFSPTAIYRDARDPGTWRESWTYKLPTGEIVSIYNDVTERKKAEDAIRESRDRFEVTLASLADAVLLVDPATRLISECNDATTRIFGYSHEELVGRETNFLHVDQAHVEQFGREAYATYDDPGYYTREFEMRRKDGSVFSTEHFVRPVRDPDGRILYVVSVVRDITDRKRVEEALRYQNEMRQTILDSIPVMVAFFDCDGHYQLINRCWQSTLGWSLEEMLQHKDVFAEFYPDPEYRKYVMDYIKNAEGAGRWSDFKTRIHDGHVLDTSWINVPLSDGSIIGIGIDITERKRAEDALTESFAIFKTVMDSLDALVYVADMKTYEILFINQYGRKIWGDLTGKICWESIQVDQKGPCQFCTNEKLLDLDNNPTGILIWEFQNTINGQWYECHDSAIRWTDGRIVRIEIASDITARKKAEETIRLALAEKEVLLREIHHRVKNNLAGILALIELQISSLSDPAVISLLKDMETRIRSMALVHESLSLTEDLARINVASYTETLTRHLFEVYRTATEVRCTIDMEDVTMSIETAIPCGLVMNEIVTNSLKYAFPDTFSCGEIRGEPSTITLTLHRDGSDYLLKIADNGIGIPEGTDVTMSHSLGLFLIRFIVEHQLRGSLLISTAGGTVYTIRFPEPVVKERNTDE